MNRLWPALLALGVVTAVHAQLPLDEQRSAWRYRRTVALPADAGGSFVAVPLPPEVQSRSQAGLRDLRLVDSSGRESPFLVHEETTRRVDRRWVGTLIEAQQERHGYTTWTVDFGQVIVFDRLELDVPGTDFARRLSVDLSSDGNAWREVGSDYWTFDRRWQGERVHDTTLDLPRGEARFVRLQADDTRSAPLDLRGVAAAFADTRAGVSWSEDVALELLDVESGRARYRVPVADGHPVRRVSLDADDAAFARRVTVYESGRDGNRAVGAGLVYRLELPGAERFEDRELTVARDGTGSLVVEVVNGDNPPLINPRVRLSGPSTLLLTAAASPSLTLYYGNTVTRAPVYELEQFRIALASVARYPMATLGDETENPSFRQPAPLSFVAPRGAVVSSGDWRFSRPFAVTGTEDLYTITVPPEELARLRTDLGDLRLVDGSDRQVPYVLEPDAAVTPLPLSVTPISPRAGARNTSSFRLAWAGTPSSGGPVRITALRLQIAEPFFQRGLTILQPRTDAPHGALPVATTTLASSPRDDAAGPVWVQIPLGAVRGTELLIEIADGDNAPLTLQAAQGVVPVPRVTFQAAPGEYRLLLGNQDAQSPSYELGSLRREVLAYAAVPLELPPLATNAVNPGYERGISDYIREAPPRAILWTALGGAVIVLLLLMRRILTRPERGDDPGV
jgi:hypothetical protein